MKRFHKFVKWRRNQRSQNFNQNKGSQETSPTLRCYKCNQPGHLKANCPTNEQWTEKTEKKNYGERKAKKAYIAWDNNDSSEGSKKEEINLLTNNYESEEDDSQKCRLSLKTSSWQHYR